MVIDKLIPIEEVTELIGVKKPTIYKYVREGNFPKPIKVGKRASRWSLNAVLEWIETKKGKTDA